MRGLRLLACLALGGLVAGAAGCGGGDESSGKAGTVTVTVGVAKSPSSAPLRLGMDKGFFKREGIQLELASAPSGAAGVAPVINGQLDAVLGGVSGVIAASAEGIPVQVVAGGVGDHEAPEGTQYQTFVSADSGIDSFKGLQGKAVAVNSLKCCWEYWTREAIEKDGGDPTKVRMLQVPFPDQVSALKKGRVDAVTTLQPFATQLLEEGYRSIGDPAAIAHDNPNNVNTYYFMSKSFIEKNPDAVRRWRRALAAASDYANSHPEETKKVIVDQTGASPELIDKMPLPRYTAEIDKPTIENAARFLVKYGVLDKVPPYSQYVWEGR